MNGFGGMPGRAYGYSAAFHVVVVALLYAVAHFHLLERPLDEEQPIVVQLVNVAPETHATQKTETPPTPEKPKQVTQVEAPKPPEPKPAPPKPAPPPESHPEPPQAAAPPPPPPPPPEPKPQQQEAKAEPAPPLPKPPPEKPQPPKKKNEDLAFDALLKNLAKRDPALTPVDQPPQKQAAAAPQSSSQPIAPLADQLSTSIKDAVIQQLEQCWNVPAGARDAKDLTPEFRVYMNRDGTVQSAQQLNPERNSDPYFQAAAEAAARALHNPQCQPLKLPPDKYDQWQTIVIKFDPKDL